MVTHRLDAIRLRGVDWFSWATAGGSSVIILTNEIGVAEVLVTDDTAWILTTPIEAERLREEEVPTEYDLHVMPWTTQNLLLAAVPQAAGWRIASDRPLGGESPLPAELVQLKRQMLPEEITRYERLGRDAALCVSAALAAAQPDWTEIRLAGEAAREMWIRGIHPTLTLVAGGTRLARHRHPFPTASALGERAMLVICGRRHGLYANMTRFVAFEGPSAADLHGLAQLRRIEAAGFNASRPGNTLASVYHTLTEAYAEAGYPGEELNHHQGGTTGYLSREVVATPHTHDSLTENMAVAWNPSLPGLKIEDTMLITANGLRCLTSDPTWPTVQADGRERPDWLWRS
ncbi:MAG: M24 family metallopeptidase [Candidatus Sericytochromatia bacterium]|nr:M24 family metallopeptidase [Candidatus Sericytochromatia bacterium]